MKKITSLLLPVIPLVLIEGSLAHAATQSLPSPIVSVQGVLNLLCYFAVYFFYTVIIITVIMIVYAAFLYVTAGDSTEKTTKARKTITYAAVGIAVSLLAVGFPNIIEGIAGGASGQTGLTPHCSILGGPSS